MKCLDQTSINNNGFPPDDLKEYSKKDLQNYNFQFQSIITSSGDFQ